MIIDEITKKEVRKMFSSLAEKVTIQLFVTKKLYCIETIKLVTSLAELSDKVEVEINNCDSNNLKAQQYQIDKYPAIIVEGRNEGQIRFFGVPSGYEFSSLVHAIQCAGGYNLGLTESTLDKIKKLKNKVHIQVFVTPTCPYSPQTVALAHKLASVSNKVTADMIEAREFKQMAIDYSVMGVPKTIINELINVDGSLQEDQLLVKLLEAQ